MLSVEGKLTKILPIFPGTYRKELIEPINDLRVLEGYRAVFLHLTGPREFLFDKVLGEEEGATEPNRFPPLMPCAALGPGLDNN